jgi:hypothetical protein
MVRIRHGWLVVVLGLAVALGACKKDEKSGNATAGKSADKAGQAGLSANAASGDDLSLLPLDSELVLGLNFSQVQQSALWKQFVQPKLMSGDVQRKLTELKDSCGFDPMTAIKSISVGLKGVGGDKPDGVVVMHGLDKAKVWACLENDKVKAEMTKDGGSFSRDGEVGLFKDKSGSQVAVAFVNDSTAIAVVGEQVTAASAKAAAAGGSTLKSSPPFVEMYSKVKSSDSLWFLINGKAKIFDKTAAMGVKPKAMFGSVNVTDGLSLDMRLRLDTPDAAAQLADMGKKQVQQAAKMFDQIDVTSDASDVKIAVVLSSQKLQALITQFSGLLGAFGGMGGP